MFYRWKHLTLWCLLTIIGGRYFNAKNAGDFLFVFCCCCFYGESARLKVQTQIFSSFAAGTVRCAAAGFALRERPPMFVNTSQWTLYTSDVTSLACNLSAIFSPRRQFLPPLPYHMWVTFCWVIKLNALLLLLPAVLGRWDFFHQLIFLLLLPLFPPPRLLCTQDGQLRGGEGGMPDKNVKQIGVFFPLREVGVGWLCRCPGIVWEPIQKRAYTQLVREHSLSHCGLILA